MRNAMAARAQRLQKLQHRVWDVGACELKAL